MARRSQFTKAQGLEAVRLAGEGYSQARIALALGVSVRTFAYWLGDGRAGDPRYASFATAFDAARAVARTKAVTRGAAQRQEAARERYRRFKASRQAWWRERLGDEEFVRRRLAWLLSKGHIAAALRLIRQPKGGEDSCIFGSYKNAREAPGAMSARGQAGSSRLGRPSAPPAER
jgi:hypothetical protein